MCVGLLFTNSFVYYAPSWHKTSKQVCHQQAANRMLRFLATEFLTINVKIYEEAFELWSSIKWLVFMAHTVF